MDKTTEKINKIINKVQEKLGDEYQVEGHTVCKNNGSYHLGARIIKNGETICPIFYLDNDIEEDISEDEIADKVVNDYFNIKDIKPVGGIEIDDFTKKKFILENVVYQLVNKEKNRTRLEKMPHKDLLDLSAVYRVIVSQDEECIGSYALENVHLLRAGITFEELDKAARENTIKKQGVTCIDLSEVIGAIAGCIPMPEGKIEDVKFGENTMYVLNNKLKSNGASLLLYNEILDKLAKKAGCDLYIIPSSIHECILMKAEETIDCEMIKEMVMTVNEEDVDETEFLSNTVYRYSLEKKELQIA